MWARLCVDVDHRGNVRGCSLEVHDEDGPTTVWTTAVGPFDSPQAALDLALQELTGRFGTAMTLF